MNQIRLTERKEIFEFLECFHIQEKVFWESLWLGRRNNNEIEFECGFFYISIEITEDDGEIQDAKPQLLIFIYSGKEKSFFKQICESGICSYGENN